MKSAKILALTILANAIYAGVECDQSYQGTLEIGSNWREVGWWPQDSEVEKVQNYSVNEITHQNRSNEREDFRSLILSEAGSPHLFVKVSQYFSRGNSCDQLEPAESKLLEPSIELPHKAIKHHRLRQVRRTKSEPASKDPANTRVKRMSSDPEIQGTMTPSSVSGTIGDDMYYCFASAQFSPSSGENPGLHAHPSSEENVSKADSRETWQLLDNCRPPSAGNKIRALESQYNDMESQIFQLKNRLRQLTEEQVQVIGKIQELTGRMKSIGAQVMSLPGQPPN
jgi:hypothetical protein